jgi:hypothetical protein
MVDLPEEGSPSKTTFLAGIERVEEMESKIDDHKSCGGPGVEGRFSSMAQGKLLSSFSNGHTRESSGALTPYAFH